jgi:hypothetical protein
MSDSYTGCDQEFEVKLNVKPAQVDADVGIHNPLPSPNHFIDF